MSFDEFWNGDCNLVKTYRELHKMREKSRNQDMWVQGMYIYEGVSVVASKIMGKKGGKKFEYPKEPYDLFGDKKKAKVNVKSAREDAVNQLNAFMKKWSNK